MTTKTPKAPELPAEAKALGEWMLEVSRSITTLQWCKARIRYGVGSTDAAENPEALTLIVANELHRRDNDGRDAWDKFESMTPKDLGDYVQAAFDALPAAPEDAEETKGDLG